jgi:hypothetical protein
MSWQDVDNKLKTKIDSRFVSCAEDYELRYLFKTIKKEYPNLSDEKIWAAIDRCCAKIPAPRPRDEYMACLRGELGV